MNPTGNSECRKLSLWFWLFWALAIRSLTFSFAFSALNLMIFPSQITLRQLLKRKVLVIVLHYLTFVSWSGDTFEHKEWNMIIIYFLTNCLFIHEYWSIHLNQHNLVLPISQNIWIEWFGVVSISNLISSCYYFSRYNTY